jgi:hypothetical protein
MTDIRSLCTASNALFAESTFYSRCYVSSGMMSVSPDSCVASCFLGYTEHNYLVNCQIFGESNFEYTPASVLNYYNFPHSVINFAVLVNFLVAVREVQII